MYILSIINLRNIYARTRIIYISVKIVMAHQNIQLIKILDAKVNQGKNKTFMHNYGLSIQYLIKIPQYYY